MHATVCLLRADWPTRTSDVAKSGQFIGQLSWVTSDPIGLKGLMSCLVLLSPHPVIELSYGEVGG